MKNIILLFLILYFLLLFQTGFLNSFKFAPNFVLTTILITIIFEKRGKIFGLTSALLGGFLLDIFSGFNFGVSTLSLVLLYFCLKLLIKLFLKINILEFSFFIIFGTFFYSLFLSSFNYLSGLMFLSQSSVFQFNLNYSTLVEIGFNLGLGIIVFYLIKYHGIFRSLLLK